MKKKLWDYFDSVHCFHWILYYWFALDRDVNKIFLWTESQITFYQEINFCWSNAFAIFNCTIEMSSKSKTRINLSTLRWILLKLSNKPNCCACNAKIYREFIPKLRKWMKKLNTRYPFNVYDVHCIMNMNSEMCRL